MSRRRALTRAFLLSTLVAAVLPAAGLAAGAFEVPGDLRGNAVLSCEALSISGNAVVTSEGLTTGPAQAGHANVRSNGDVLLNGSVEVHGDATAGPGHAVRLSGQPALVTGQKGVAATPFACAPIDLVALQTSLLASNDNAGIPATDRGKPALSGPNGRTLSLSGKDAVTLPAGTYLLDELRLTGNSRVRIAGPVRILVTGSIDIGGGSNVDLDGNAFDVRLWSAGGSVAVASQSNLFAYVYAPLATVSLTGQSRVVGAVHGKSVTISGGARVLRVVDDAPPTVTISTPVDGTSVDRCEVVVGGTVVDAEGAVQVTINGAAVQAAADGSFTGTANLATSDPGLVEVAATDASGNVSRASVRVHVDAPTATLVSPAPGTLLGTRLVDLAGTSHAASAIVVGGKPATIAADGTWRISGFDLGPDDGVVTLELAASNCAGSARSTAALELDTHAPQIAIQSPVTGALVGSSPITVSGSVEDAHLKSVTVNGVAATVSAGRFTATIPLTEGMNTLAAVATDVLGARTTSATVKVELDTSSPSVAILAPTSGQVVGAHAIDVVVHASAPHLAGVTVNGQAAAFDGTNYVAHVPLQEGDNALTARATDTLNRHSDASVIVVADTLAPTVSLDPLPAAVDATAIDVSGSVTDPHLASVTVNGVVARVVGNTFLASAVPLQEGPSSIVAHAVDSLAHASDSAAATVVRDTLPPVVAITEPTPQAQLSSTNVTVRGTADDPHLAHVTVGGVEATLDGGSFSAMVQLPEGESTIAAHAVDSFGHAADSPAIPVTVDTRAPVVHLDSPEEPVVATAKVKVTGTVDEPHLESLTVAGIPATIGDDGTFSVSDVPLVEGSNSITAIARDTFGNEATSEPALYVLDTAAPVLTVSSPAPGSVVTTAAITVAGTVSDEHLFGVTVNGVAATVDEAAQTFTAEVPLAAGANHLPVVATDRAGNATTVLLDVNYVVDDVPPVVTLDQPSAGADSCLAGGTPVTLAGTYADDHRASGADGQPAPVAVVVIDAAGGQQTFTPPLDATGHWSIPAAFGAADGQATVAITATDAFGNTTRLVRTFRVDASAPGVRVLLDGVPVPSSGPGSAPPAGTTPKLFGRVVAASASVDDAGAAALPVAQLTLDGAAYTAGTRITTQGAHLVVATVSDCAGHTATAYASFLIDTVAPTLHGTTPADGSRLTTAPTAFTGSSDPDLATVTVNGVSATVGAGGSFSRAPFAAREGSNDVDLELVDRAGNRATFQVAFALRTVPLSVRILESGAPIPAGQVFQRAVHPQVQPSDSSAQVTATLDGVPFTSGSEVASPGNHRVTATIQDDWGRTAQAEATFGIDLSPAPSIAITAPADGAVLATASPRVEGTAAGDGVTITVNGVPATVSGGTWSVAALPLDRDAGNTIVAIARDAHGRTATASIAVRVATGGPQVLILEPAEGTSTNRAAIDVAGTIVGGRTRSADGTVSIQPASGPARTVALAADGSFRATDVQLAAGVNHLTATVKDAQGRAGTASVTVNADFTAPRLRFLVGAQPLVDGASFAQAVTVSVEVADDIQVAGPPEIRVNGAQQTNAALPRTDIAFTAGGGYLLDVTARDAAGNETRGERSFVLGFSGCVLADVDPAAGSSTENTTVTLVGRAAGASAMKVRVPQPGGGAQEYSGSVADGTFLLGDVPLPILGDNALELVCTDSGGNVQSTPYPIRRVAAGTGPTITIDSPAGGAVVGSDAVDVHGTVSTGTVTVNGAPATVSGTSFSRVGVALTEGPNPIRARAVDAGGRTAEARVVVERDSQAPRVQITTPDNHSHVGIGDAGAATVDVSGSVDVDDEPHLAHVVVATAKGSVEATVDGATGVFHAASVPLDATADGVAQTITATATDSLAHSGSSSIDVTLDTSGPAIVLHAPDDLLRFGPGSPAVIAISGEAWASAGASVSINGVDLDPATLVWDAATADGRRHVAFTAQMNVPSTDGTFGVVARATELDGRWAQDRRLLYRDTTGPKVVEIDPADGASGVDGNAMLLVLFSEPVLHGSLDAANGLTLTRVSTGQEVVGTKTVAGQAVAFVPGAALIPGESYVFRAGTGITDVAGNPIVEAGESHFTIAAQSAASAPVLDALPPVVCADELDVTGHATAGATVKVRDGELVFTGFADASGAFTVTLPVTGSGYHLLVAWVVDSSTGASGPQASTVVRVDCQSPQVVQATFDRASGLLRIVFSEEMRASTVSVGDATTAVRLLDADTSGVYRAGALSWPSTSVAEIALDTATDAWWRDRPVRLQVGPPAADGQGNAMAASYETVFFPGGGDLSGGFLSGEAYDDASGRPLPGAQVRLFAGGSALPGSVASAAEATPVAAAVTDARGRFVLTASGGSGNQVAPGRYTLVIDAQGNTRVYRQLSLRPAAVAVPFDSRLTPLASAAGTLQPATGGTVSATAGAASGAVFTIDSSALPGDDAVTVTLTRLSGQGLPDFLPLGWTPAAAVHVRLEQAGAALPEVDLWSSGAARVELPLPSWIESGDELFAARYEPGTGRWIALSTPEIVGGVESARRARVAVAGPGTVAIVVPDSESTTRPPLPNAAGEALAGVERPASVPALAATLTLDPPIVAPTGRSQARAVAHSSDGSTPWPSGLAVQAFLAEKLELAGGAGEVLEAPFSADLVLYHPRLSAAEQGATAAGAAGAMAFIVSPSPRAAQVLLEVGWENIRLFPFPEEVDRGSVIGPDGGTIDTPSGVELAIPEGALSNKVPVGATLLGASELAALPAVAGYDTVAAVRVDLSGATLARAATLSLPTPASTPADSPASPRVIVAELVSAPLDGRGALARLAARTVRTGSGASERIVAAPEGAGALPLEGIVREGVYLVLAAHQPLAFATGFVRNANASPLQAARVTSSDLGTGDLSALDGRYSVPVVAGTDRHLEARHPTLDERATGSLASIAPGAVASLDLTVQVVPPRVLSVTPLDGSTAQPLGSVVSVLWSEPLDPQTVTATTLTLELADGNGTPSGIFVAGAVSLVEGTRIVFTPSRPLLPGWTYLAHLSGSVADVGGALYAGGPLLWRFTTSTIVSPGGQVHPEKFHVRVPVNGVAQIYGDPGALPGSTSGSPPWVVSPEIEGPVADPVRDSFQGNGDGSFTGTVGHPPGFAVTLDSRIWVKVFDPSGTLAAELRVGPFTTPDGLGFVAPAGEAVSFRSAEGLLVDVPAAAFDKATLVTIKKLDPASVGVPTPAGLGLGAYVSIDFDGEAKETLRVSVPAPADAVDGAQVFIGTPADLPWGRRLQLLSVGGVLTRDGQRLLSNDPSLQPEPPAGTDLREIARTKTLTKSAGRTCAQARQQGLPQCFLQSLLMEFRLRDTAAFFYEWGASSCSLMYGAAGSFAYGVGLQFSAIYDNAADDWVYLPVPHDWNGGFVLPVLSNQPLELVQRDMATGWVQGTKPYDPISPTDDLVPAGSLGGNPRHPLLIDAKPFQLYRLAAPAADDSTRLSLEVEVATDVSGRVTVHSIDDYPIAAGSSVGIYDLAPALPPSDKTPSPPVSGPQTTVCDPEQPWSIAPVAGSDQMLVVVGPGGLDAASTTRLELQFDQPLKDVSKRPADEVVHLLDLGPIEESCESAAAAGYPLPLSFTLEQEAGRSRLAIVPTAPLAAGHRFRLELVPSAIAVETPTGSELTYWDSAPTKLDFATRDVPGDPISGMPDGTPALGSTSIARDMLKLGNLLLVASETGDMVAIDTSDSSHAEGLKRYAIDNKGVRTATRALATDGHNRVFYAGLFGSVWGIKTLRLEDIRSAKTPCVGSPSWAEGLPCFEGVEGAARVAYALGSTTGTTAEEWLALGTLPEATPMQLSVLAQDEKGKTLEAADFARTYRNASGLSDLTPDGEGIYTFDVTLKSTLVRSQASEPEPSLPPGTKPEPAVAAWRKEVCEGEKDYDRYQRVTIDNLTTGQTWSIDIENPWPDGSGNGVATVQGVRARRGDQLRVRYNLRTIGHVALMGSGITIVDLNRFYRLTQPYQTAGAGQCGRRLGKFEGQSLQLPACAPPGASLAPLAMTPAVVAHSKTGCESGTCRGDGFVDIYSPLQGIGGLHSRSTLEAPGGTSSPMTGTDTAPDALQLADLAACIGTVDHQPTLLRDVALANDVEWTYRGVQGAISGTFTPPEAPAPAPRAVRGDLLFLSLGAPGVYVFDVGARSLTTSSQGGPALIGRLAVPGHSIYRLQVDNADNVLFAGGTDAATGKSIIDVWSLSAVNSAPGLEGQATPIATLDAPWSTNHLGVDGTGTGLVYTWGPDKGAQVVPFDRARFVFSGLYRQKDDQTEHAAAAEQKITSRFVPLGVPLETTLEAEREHRFANEERATAAFKLRVALPGSLGPELTAKVQSLRMLPGERSLGNDDVGAAVAPPGGPGWPTNEVVVRLRRVGLGQGETSTVPLDGEAGPLATAYQLYESVETVLLVADPRASAGYHRQDSASTTVADEAAQCRRCDWPGYLPDPLSNDPALENVKQLLAGPYVRAYLFASDVAGTSAQQATENAIAFFAAKGESYPLPAGTAELAGAADEVPSPVQVSLAEPAQNPAVWDAGEAGVAAALAGGELLLDSTDRRVEGRSLPFTFERTYRSGALGYGPLGSAGWTANLFAHLRELPATGEVEYHDGLGHTWRFLPRSQATSGASGATAPAAPPDGYEDDSAGSYFAPKGVYLRLEKLSSGGWRLIGQAHDIARFDAAGRLVEISDRHRRDKSADEQGSTITLHYDAFDQLDSLTDDLGRRYRFRYYENPRPVGQGGDGPRYGLLRSFTDFAQREVAFEYDDDRRLDHVQLPEVSNSVPEYAQYSYRGEARPTIVYHYDPPQGVDASPAATSTALHGEFARLRLASFQLPHFLENDVPRARFEYDRASGRFTSVGFPTPQNQNDSIASVIWQLRYPSAAADTIPVQEATVHAPWGHDVVHTLDAGRIVTTAEQLEVYRESSSPSIEPLATTWRYADDGRLLQVDRPDGSRISQCFADGKGGAGCDSPNAVASDRLQKANVVATIAAAVTASAKGSADYDSIVNRVTYDEDNQPAQVTDGEGREVQIAVPKAGKSDTTQFKAESVSSHFDYDRYGRVTRGAGGGEGGPVVRLGYGDDAQGHAGAGLLEQLDRGEGDQVASRQKLVRDPTTFDVHRVETSQGSNATIEHDEWDRAVETTSGVPADDRLATVGTSICDEGAGAKEQRAFDAVGHVIRERKLQDFIDPADGLAKCRFVEAQYVYDAGERLVSVAETNLSDPTHPGAVRAEPQVVKTLEYDPDGRLVAEHAKAVSRHDLDTRYQYDDAGRPSLVTRGEEGTRRQGYDELSRVVFATDGDDGIWRGRYDAWGHLYQEVQPTGAVVRRRIDRAGNPIEETVFDADPTTTSANVLADTKLHVTSFGAVDRVSQALTAPSGNVPGQARVTERGFDLSGRLIEVWSGPPVADDLLRVDRSKGRRDATFEYEPVGGRIFSESYGGDTQLPPVHGIRYGYAPENASPWFDTATLLESVPGQPDLVPTTTTTYRHDALGRVVDERRSDGSVLFTTYDRSGGAIDVRDGAGTHAKTSFDGRGLPLQVWRPNGRGSTIYAYDLDGSRLVEQTQGVAGSLWQTSTAYDATGRPSDITYADGSHEVLTYYSDSTVHTRRTRDGLLVTYTYDAANRLKSAVPDNVDGVPSSTALDAGDALSYDLLSRPTLLERGRVGSSGLDADLSVRYPSYDLGSRPDGEIVGSRAALGFGYDTWDHSTSVSLPGGVGRGSGSFTGFQRRYDTVGRVVDVSGAGAAGLSPTAVGATWAWGGGDRLYAMTTRGALQTAARFGYYGGAGAQPPGSAPQGAKWKLATLTWGSAGGAGITSEPQKSWGAWAFGWRGNENTPQDGVKLGRQVFGDPASDGLFANLGWSFAYDAGARLETSVAGAGDLTGAAARGLVEPGTESYSFTYGSGDELERIVRAATGRADQLTPGPYGRVEARNGVAFAPDGSAYDGAGRRREDDRFVYTWDWRGQLVRVTVKDTWPDEDGDGKPEVTPWAGHQVRYDYDASGRLLHRWLYGKLPSGSTDEAQRPFIEKRSYVWEGSSLLAEAAFGNAEETILRWRKTYVPGPHGLDDAVQVVVEIGDQPGNPYSGSTHTYTLVRDEMGTVTALVAEDEATADPARPPVPVRYRYTPFGQAHAESGPELQRARFDAEVSKVDVNGTVLTQVVSDANAAAAGALRLQWSAALDTATLPAGLHVEKLSDGTWTQLGAEEVAVGVAPLESGSSAGGGGPPSELLVMPPGGWARGTRYRVRLGSEVRDTLGRSFAGTAANLEWSVPETQAGAPVSAVFFDKVVATEFESWKAAGDAVGGRVPGGAVGLFEGLWTDPVTGISYARARWYDARTAAWLCEDPAGAVDSPSLYAFVGQQPNMGVDPLGLITQVTVTADGKAVPDQDVNGTELYQQLMSETDDSGHRKYTAEQASRFVIEAGMAADIGADKTAQMAPYVIAAGQLSNRLMAGAAGAGIFGGLATVGAGAAGLGFLASNFVVGSTGGLGWQLGEDAASGHLSSAWDYGVSMGEGVGFSLAFGGVARLASKPSGSIKVAPDFIPDSVPERELAHLEAGQMWEGEQLAADQLTKNTTRYQPTPAETRTAAFRAIVGEPKYTPQGELRSTIFDADDPLQGLIEYKGGKSELGSSYQLRLQTYRSVTTERPYTIKTSRPINPTFQEYLDFWGVKVVRPQ